MLYDAEEGQATLALGGDVMLSRRLSIYKEDRFLALRDILAGADACFANLESIVLRYGEGSPSVREGTYMVTEPHLLDDMKWFGFNLLSCSNSHSLNFGEAGLNRQNDYLDAAGIVHAGTGANLRQACRPAFLDTPRGRFALIAATAHLPSDQCRATNAGLDFGGKPGVNALGFDTTFVVDGPSFEALKRIGASLGLDRQRQRIVDHGFSTDTALRAVGEATYSFRGDRYRLGNGFEIHTACNKQDMEENLRQIREARRQADWVVMSLHNQDMPGRSWLTAEKRTEITEQPEFVQEFARHSIDAGADVFACHGPHIVSGIEIYKGKPIFYGLGNLVLQNETLRHVPAYHLNRYGLDPNSTPADFFDHRTGNGTKGHPASPEYWQSMVATCAFESGRLSRIEIYPVDLGFGRTRPQRGRPMIADDELGKTILDRIARMSATHGTRVTIEGNRGIIKVD